MRTWKLLRTPGWSVVAVRDVDGVVRGMGLGFDRGCAGRTVEAPGGRFDGDRPIERLRAGEVMHGDGGVIDTDGGTAHHAHGDREMRLGCAGGAFEAVHDATSLTA